MAFQVLDYIEGIEDQLSSLHISAFPMGLGWKAKDMKELLDISFHHILIDYDIDNKINGFLLYSVIVDEAEILTFCVSPERQQEGIGQAIIAVFLEEMKKQSVKIVFLEVAEDNIAALKLYNRFGFSLNGRRTKYYDNKIDALLMAKTLSN